MYDFLDYRAFLRAAYEAEKARRPSFSYRVFARRAGLKSPNLLKRVIDGERSLGSRTLPKFIRALGLDAEAAAFFTELVQCSRLESEDDKSRALQRLQGIQFLRHTRWITGEYLEYFSRWYYQTIYVLAYSSDFRDDPEWIASQLRPKITLAEAASALELLFAFGLLVRDETTGRATPVAPRVWGGELPPRFVAGFHRQLLDLAVQSLQTVPRERRVLSGLTVCITPAMSEIVKQRLEAVVRDLSAELTPAERDGSIVYQGCVAWFPVSAPPPHTAEKPSSAPQVPAAPAQARVETAVADVYEFFDYRAYLRAFYQAEKARKPTFSYRLFSRRAGLKSPNLLKRIIDGERNLSLRMVPRFVRALGLDAGAAAFFADLVRYSRLESEAEKKRLRHRLLGIRDLRDTRHITRDLLEYYSHWYYQTTYVLAYRADFRADPAWIASELRPEITPTEAASALDFLLSVGLLARDETTGQVTPTAPYVWGQSELSLPKSAAYFRQLFDLAARSMESGPAENRTMRAITACVSPGTSKLAKEKLESVVRELAAELTPTEREGSVVYQLCAAWFPLSAWPGETASARPPPSRRGRVSTSR